MFAEQQAQIKALLTGVAGIVHAAPNPIEMPARFPFAMVYLHGGRWERRQDAYTYTESRWAVEIHVLRAHLPRAVDQALDFSESIPNVLLKPENRQLGGNANNLLKLGYIFGFLRWGAGEDEHLGWQYLATYYRDLAIA